MSSQKTLRKYQDELIQPGVLGFNYIISAPTGSGKTLAAASLTYHRMINNTSQTNSEFKAIFIVPTRHLKSQQRDAFLDVFKYPTAVSSIAKTQQFRTAFTQRDTKVLMMTAQILVNALREGDLRFSELSMLIFDECHHTTLNHPYNEIMKVYIMEKKKLIEKDSAKRGKWLVGRPFGTLPQVVGLTASLGTGGRSDAVRHITNLCANLDCSGVKTVEDRANLRELQYFNNLPELDRIETTNCRAPSKICDRFIEILKNIMSTIEQQKPLGKTFCLPNKTLCYGTEEYQTVIGPLVGVSRKEKNMNACAALTFLFQLNVALMTYNDIPAKYVLYAFEKFRELGKHEFNAQPLGRICQELCASNAQELTELAEKEEPLEIPKLKRLITLLEQIFERQPHSRGIVLARTRFATAALLHFISHREVMSGMIRPTRIVGQGKDIDYAQAPSKQEAALGQFRRGESNLLIATDIVQEGLDVPACNFVIRYNFVSNEIGTVQSKGRARANNSQCFLIVEKYFSLNV